MTSTKISGLAVDTEYSFYMVLRTSGGTYTSNTLDVRTHDMKNLTGITITPGVLPPQLMDSLQRAVERIGAKLVDTVRIDTTHFVCTEGRGRDWEKANEMNIPIVRPEWIEGCEREGKLIGVRGYYLDADPKQRQIGSNPSLPANRASGTTPTTTPQQSNLPSRPNVVPPPSPGQESTVSGEPGPELPPTPPIKDQKELPPAPSTEDEEEEEEEEGEGDDDEEIPPRPTVESKEKDTAESSDEESSSSPPPPAASNNHQKAKVEDGKEGADMEDVAL